MGKEYCVWYQGGGGGYIVSWLIQVALDSSTLDQALSVFPLEINQDHAKWKKWEVTPPAVGLLCNSFYSAPGYEIDKDHMIRETLAKLSTGGESFWDLVHCRIKYYLLNYVYQSGHITTQKFKQVKQNLNCYRLNDQDHIKQQSDLLFNLDRNIFVVAPDRYVELASITKKLKHTTSNLNQILVQEFSHLKLFDLSAIWQNRWIPTLEKIINRSLDQSQQNACAVLIDRYIAVMPAQVRNFCNAN